MRSESASSSKTDSLETERSEHFGGHGMSQPRWRIVDTSKSNSFAKDFAEPVLVLMTNLVRKEIEEMSKQLEKEKSHGSTR